MGTRSETSVHDLRIALVCPYSWSVPGGVQTHVSGLARALRAGGLQVDILAPADGPFHEPGLVPLGRSVGIPDNGAVTRIALSPASVVRAARRVRSSRYDLVHLHEPVLPTASFTALHAAAVPVVGTFHMLHVSERWYRLFAPVVRRAARRLRARIAVSEPARRFVSRWLPGDYHVIPNAVHVAQYGPPGARRDGRRLLFIGRPEPRKGLPVLLAALARLPRDVTLDHVGVAPAELSVLARGAGIPRTALARVRPRGKVSDDERRRLLTRADVLCVPSLGGESFGLVLVEGMAAGVPVIASDIPGYRDVLPPSCGRLVPPADSDLLAAAVAELLADGALRLGLGEEGRREAARFDWSVVAPQVLSVYRAALDGGRPG
ncbi:MAG: glycosyltransferase family 4 protein [Actinomycetota bacterium]|nr:glycosyltransferase family 4 protein [Actinomycetota bacterium]